VVAVHPKDVPELPRPCGASIRGCVTTLAEARGLARNSTAPPRIVPSACANAGETGNAGCLQGQIEPRLQIKPPQNRHHWCTCRTFAPKFSRSPAPRKARYANLGSIKLGALTCAARTLISKKLAHKPLSSRYAKLDPPRHRLEFLIRMAGRPGIET